MNILLVTQFIVPHKGGLSSHVEDLILCLNNDGHKVKLLEGSSIATGTLRKLINFIISGGIKDFYLDRRLQITLAKLTNHAEKLIRHNSFDIVHCHDPVAGYAIQLALSKAKQEIPVIETIHGPPSIRN